MKKAVIGIVRHASQAESLVSQLKATGFQSRHISVLLPSTEGVRDSLALFGIPEMEVDLYEGTIRDGNLLLAVQTNDPEMRARADTIFERNGAHDDVSTMREAHIH